MTPRRSFAREREGPACPDITHTLSLFSLLSQPGLCGRRLIMLVCCTYSKYNTSYAGTLRLCPSSETAAQSPSLHVLCRTPYSVIGSALALSLHGSKPHKAVQSGLFQSLTTERCLRTSRPSASPKSFEVCQNSVLGKLASWQARTKPRYL